MAVRPSGLPPETAEACRRPASPLRPGADQPSPIPRPDGNGDADDIGDAVPTTFAFFDKGPVDLPILE